MVSRWRSCQRPPVYSHLDTHTPEFCRLLNDFQAEVAQAAPGRFRSFLHLPVYDVPAALQELSRWGGRAEVAGVLFGSHPGRSQRRCKPAVEGGM